MNNTNTFEKEIKGFINELISQKAVPIAKKENLKRVEFNEEYNACRILIILRFAGVNSKIDSKLKFTFYDFLIRYPICLKMLLDKNDIKEDFLESELYSIDKKMIKHISSAWDPDYYNYLGYLESRGLIICSFNNGYEISLTEKGIETAKKLEIPETERWIRRCKIIKKLLGGKSENYLHEIIKVNFSFIKI